MLLKASECMGMCQHKNNAFVNMFQEKATQ